MRAIPDIDLQPWLKWEKHRIVGGANLLQVFEPQSPSNPHAQKKKCGKKQKMQGFSAKSRYNLAKELSAIEWPISPAHITLTYHLEWPDEPKAHLNRVRQWFVDQGMCGVWRLEWQSRDGGKVHVPHYHLLISGFSEEHEAKLRRWWEKVSGNGSPYAVHFSYREAGRAAWYLALHAGKDSQVPKGIQAGRLWGWIDGPKVKDYQTRVELGNLTDRQTYRLKRIVRSLSKGRLRPNSKQSFSVFLSTYWQHRVLLYLESHYGEEPF